MRIAMAASSSSTCPRLRPGPAGMVYTSRIGADNAALPNTVFGRERCSQRGSTAMRHEQRAKVVVLERAPKQERGGQSRYTEAYLRMKSRTEVTDDFETILAENSSG